MEVRRVRLEYDARPAAKLQASGQSLTWPGGQGVGNALSSASRTEVPPRPDGGRNLVAEYLDRTHELERRGALAESLRDILTILNSNRPLDEVLDYIVERAATLLEADGVGVYRLEVKDGLLSTQTSRGLDVDFVAGMEIPVSGGVVGQTVLKGKPLVLSRVADIIPNALEQMPAPSQQRLLTSLVETYSSVLAVPLIVKDELYGAITLYYHQPRELSDDDVELAMAFSDQAALAIENARLIDQAEEAAVAAERSRLARELHDAVTQTLFSASLIAEVLPRLWESNPEEGRRRLAELRRLTRGALAEMRTLLLELRPTALVEAEIGELLRQLADAATSTAGMPVELSVEGDCRLPPDVQIAIYRVAQEALNNVARHAHAARAQLELVCRGAEISLSIADDGSGFDRQAVGSESLGLGIMRERAEAIGAVLDIQSRPNEGTRVTLVWSESRKE